MRQSGDDDPAGRPGVLELGQGGERNTPGAHGSSFLLSHRGSKWSTPPSSVVGEEELAARGWSS
jgi:hypothetical protein